jgi:hypothetical protein
MGQHLQGRAHLTQEQSRYLGGGRRREWGGGRDVLPVTLMLEGKAAQWPGKLRTRRGLRTEESEEPVGSSGGMCGGWKSEEWTDGQRAGTGSRVGRGRLKGNLVDLSTQVFPAGSI